MTTLEVRNLRKNFGDVAALTDVSLTVKPGEIYGFVGSNGAGKSTTMRIILGVLAADAGEVLWDGKPRTPRGFWNSWAWRNEPPANSRT